jgi:glycerol-3-phosphate O-acyltransferase
MLKSKYETRAKSYDPILPAIGEWPVVKLGRTRKEFIEDVIRESFSKIKQLRNNTELLKEELEITMFRERLRVKENPWKVDPEDEQIFWSNVKKQLLNLTNEGNENVEQQVDQILREVLSRYANEICGNFKTTHYRLARTIVTFGFGRLLNAAKFGSFLGLFKGKLTLQDKIHIEGEIDQLRNLAKSGTIVMVPTHFSNLDSITIGFVIHSLGLPPFIYGAGLNLFNIAIFAYFMNSLGAYKVDRRKKNMIYLETLKMYSSIAIQNGIHSLFFPGGTRSRSGKLESRLKLGLLSTAMEAQRINYQNANGNSAKKIFIVPVVLNYNFVLEAAHLISDYLEKKGQERFYTESDQFSSSYKIVSFLVKFFTRGADMSVTIGRAMDLFGNNVDELGNSLDQKGNIVDIRDYFTKDGKIIENAQRDGEYTRMLGDKIVVDFYRYAQCSASHLAAFTGFEIIKNKNSKLDLYSLFRIPVEDLEIEYNEFAETFLKLRDIIFKFEESGRIRVSESLRVEEEESLIKSGVNNVGTFHAQRPLLFNKEGNIISKDLKTLYYYRNRLDGYDFEKYI